MICKCETLNITEKNDEQILVTVMRGFEQEASENESEGTPQPFPVEISTDIDVKLTTPRAQRLPIDFTVGDEGRILIDLKADRVKAGTTYGLEVTGQVNGSRWCAIGDSVIRITRTTERGPKQVKVDADPYEVTLWAGYVGDVMPRHLRDLEGYTALTQLLDAMGETLGKKANTEDVTAALKNISDRLSGYIPTSDKGKAGGVATLDSVGKILAAQLNMPWRGNFEGNFHASDTEPGIWGIDNRVIGPKPLNGEAAHGVMLVFPDRYKTTIFLVGPPNGAAAGNAPEIYARRWMTGSKSWTSWLTTANFARKDEIPQTAEYTIAKDFYSLQLIKDGKVQSEVKNLYPPMSLADALKDTDWVQQNHHSITQSVLRQAIEHRTKNKATIDFVNSSIQTATAEFRGTHPSLEALQAVEADRNDYGYVEETDTDGNILVHRYKYVEGTGWQFEYDLNRTGFTAAEWQAIKSGITPEDVEKLRELPEKDTVMPLTRITDRTKVEAVVDADDCTEPGIYENVQKPAVPNDFGLSITIQGEVCVLLVSEIYGENNHEVAISLDTNGSQQVSEILYKELVQFAVGKDFAAVRTCRKRISSTDGRIAIPTFTPWKQFALKSDLPSMQVVGASAVVEVPANGRKNTAIDLNVPEGYTFGAYRSVALNGADSHGEDFKTCAIQSYGSAGGGMKANVAVKNFANTDATLTVTVQVLFFKNAT